jgi:ATP synthase protein I
VGSTGDKPDARPATRRDEHDRLAASVERQTERLRRATGDRPTLIAQTRYLGTIGVLLALPAIAGAYLGHWLDGMQEGYSVRWTVSLIFFGVVTGAISVYLFVRE